MTKPTRIDANTPERFHYKTLVETDAIGQWDLPKDRDVVVIIEALERYTPAIRRSKELDDGTKVPEPLNKVRIFFKGKRKYLIAGPTLQASISKMYGRVANDWIGKPVALYVDPKVKFGREETGGVRIRPTVPRGKPPSDDPLDNPVDPQKAAQLDQAAGRTE